MIKGNRINLRLIKDTDIELVENYYNDIEERGLFLPLDLLNPVHFKKGFAEGMLWSDKHGKLLIENKDSQIVGEIAYFKAEEYMPGYELGFLIYKNADRAKGYMSEALSMMTKFIFESRPIERIQIKTVSGNQGVKRLSEKCGFTFEGIERHGLFIRGQYKDLEVYSMLRDELPTL